MLTDSPPPIHAIGKGLIGAAGASLSWVSDHLQWLPDAIRVFSFYGGAVVVVLSLISLTMDIRRKWKRRND
jgi:hypothetical protein